MFQASLRITRGLMIKRGFPSQSEMEDGNLTTATLKLGVGVKARTNK
jgi:hypothetical protein